MSHLKKIVYLLIVLAPASFTALAADTVDLDIIGSIIPSSCMADLSHAGVVDYGDIGIDDLASSDRYTALNVKELNFSISCGAGMKIALKTKNGRLGSVVSDYAEGIDGLARSPVMLFGEGMWLAAGLGLDGGTKIGGFSVRLQKDLLVDGDVPQKIAAADGTAAWILDESGALFRNGQVNAWAANGEIQPIALSNLSGAMEVQAYLNKKTALDLSKEIKLDGLAIFEIVYL
ncbi:DUF1120 domain-containing protein [Acinetobacter courvalinii]|uniref:DUF1120 domain-containing protein n=1 Tax=Acinetobacter courvalinii TaxID=280147 RepID=UPI0021CEE9C8|nr:DUF1120 domain-containing protein [Acinetobacter courvalinii]MCU4369587.1 DUF1120 domain-containing protein [Acinetobacter courvalinii]MCU4447792.1 DUF1120 domain-containing protein [Acinetobacter courvalinii]